MKKPGLEEGYQHFAIITNKLVRQLMEKQDLSKFFLADLNSGNWKGLK